MKVQPLVSVIAINYNNSPWLRESLDSIKNQTYDNIEIIVVDDCSTDGSNLIIEDWIKNCNKDIKYVQHSSNQGICKTCNSGFSIAKGDYLSYVATDDVLFLDKIAHQVRVLESTSTQVGAVYSDAMRISETGDLLEGSVMSSMSPTLKSKPTGQIFELLLERNFILPASVLIKRLAFIDIGYFDESLKVEDRDFFLRLSKKYQILYSEQPSVLYRERKQSLSKVIRFWDTEFVSVYLKHWEHPLAMDKLRHFSKTLYYTKNFDKVLLLSGLKNDPIIATAVFLSKHKIPKLFSYPLFFVASLIRRK